tara:strand:- start:51724 stop:52149 length:426 start_codon:yes stop_codon:yes gene_type:complete
MYVYKVLVNALPPTNKIKLVSLINQSSCTAMDPVSLTEYEYGIICQANATYVGVILVRLQKTDAKQKLILDHFCVLPHQRRKKYATSMFECLKSELNPTDRVDMRLNTLIPEWQVDLLERWGWQKSSDTAHEQEVMYTLTL